MWRAYIVGALLVQGALIIHALPQVTEGTSSWTAKPSLSASSTTGNQSIADIDVDQAFSSKVNQSAVQSPYLSDKFEILGTDLIADVALFRTILSYVEVVSVLQLAADDIRRNKHPEQELRSTYTIVDKELGVDTSFFIRSGVVLSRRYLTYEVVLKVIEDGLLDWVQKRVQERKGLHAFSFRIFSTGMPFVFVDGAVDRSIKTM